MISYWMFVEESSWIKNRRQNVFDEINETSYLTDRSGDDRVEEVLDYFVMCESYKNSVVKNDMMYDYESKVVQDSQLWTLK